MALGNVHHSIWNSNMADTELYLALCMNEGDYALAKACNFGRKPEGETN